MLNMPKGKDGWVSENIITHSGSVLECPPQECLVSGSSQ